MGRRGRREQEIESRKRDERGKGRRE